MNNNNEVLLMKRGNTLFILIFIVIFMMSLLISCKGKDEGNKNAQDNSKVPSSLEQVEKLSEEIVKTTMDKDWPKSLDSANELQIKWNELYAQLSKKGVLDTTTSEFVEDLNKLSDALITKTLTLPRTKIVKEDSGDQEKSTQGSTQQTQQGQSMGDTQQGQSDMQQQGQQDSQSSQEQQQLKIEPTESQKILSKVDPTLIATKEELEIINYSIELTKSIPSFMGLYSSDVPPEIYTLKYLIRHLNLSAKLENWEEAYTTGEKIIKNWDTLELKMIKKNEELAVQIKQGIKELEEVLVDKNTKIIGMKGNNILEYLDESVEIFKDKK